jgi:hypothetical protein
MTLDLINDITHNPDTMAKLLSKYHIAEKKITIFNRTTKQAVKAEKNTGIKF